MVIGQMNVNQKVKNAKVEKFPSLLVEHIDEAYDYYLILVDKIYKASLEINALQSDLDCAGIKSYCIVSCINVEEPKLTGDGTEDVVSCESDWRKYLKTEQSECRAIICFGRAIRLLNKSADISYLDFMDDLWNPSRYFCGKEFIGGPDKWVYPCAPLTNVYPFAELNKTKLVDVVSMHTRFARKQYMKVLTDDMSLKSIDTRPYEIITANNREEANRYLELLYNSELLAVDTETSGFDYINDRLGTIQMCNDGVHGYVWRWEDVDKRRLRKVLSTAKRITLANAKFDMKFIYRNGVTGWYPTDDTTLLAHCMNSWRPKGLKPNTWYTDGAIGGYDDELDRIKKILKVRNYLQIPFPTLSKYAGMDPIATWRQQVYLDEQCHKLDIAHPNEKEPAWTSYMFYKEIMIPNLEAVFDTEYAGIYFHKDLFDDSAKKILDVIDGCVEELSRLWRVPKTFEFSSTDKLGKLFEKMGWPCIEKNKKGVYSTSDTVLTEYERLNMPGIKTLRRYRSFCVAKNTFVKGWGNFLRQHEDGTWRIHANTNTFGTETMRHSMNDPNFQQIPSGGEIAPYIKKLFATPPSRQHYEVTDESGQVWNNDEFENVLTQRGSVAFADLDKNDIIRGYDYNTAV